MDKRTKWSYCIGATGRDAAYALVSMYLILYVQYTMNLSTAQYATISVIMILCMVWDAVNDLLMGIIIENSHMKFGKFKPWILIGSLLNAFVIIGLFTIRPTGWGYVAFFAAGYLCWGMTYTMNDIAYWGLLPSLSSDPKVRDSLVTVMSVFICIGQFSVAGIVPIVIAGNAVVAYRTVALIVALAFIAFQMLTAFGVRENPEAKAQEHISLRQMFGIFARNDQLVVAGISSILYNIANNLLIMFGVNFFYVEFGYSESGELITLFTVMYGLGMLISQALYSTLSKKFSRKQIISVCICALVLGYLGLLGIGYVLPKNLILLNAIGFLIFFFQGLYNLAVIVMINNTIEYDEVRFNERHDSVISAVRSFSVKLASGLNQGICTLILIASGIYAVTKEISELEATVGRGELEPEVARTTADGILTTITGGQGLTLRLGMCLIPVVVLVISYVLLMKKYKIDEKKYNELLATIKGKKASDEG
ncbi:MAG: MFS transporter [Lachnospiraceae bacterium]|nr:MFS transporter [Lachnospiraceae bacterium]MBP5184932.1 MFS transporter [Lachnospiraceae bacterium]